VLKKHFTDWSLAQLSTGMDLERSFGPIYARGLIKRGLSAFAVLGVNRQELQSSIDAALTFGILWLDSCRTRHAGELATEGLKLIVPKGVQLWRMSAWPILTNSLRSGNSTNLTNAVMSVGQWIFSIAAT
jgi:hypothetical protein